MINKDDDVVGSSAEKAQKFYDKLPLGVTVEDYSSVKQRLDTLREEGVRDFGQYLIENPDEQADMVRSIRVIVANDSMLSLYQVNSFKEYMDMYKNVPEWEDSGWADSYVQIITNLAHEQSYFGEYSDVTADGDAINIRFVSWVSEGHEQDWSSVVTTHEDISQHKRVEQDLRNNEQRFRALFHQSPLGVTVEDYSTVKKRIDQLRSAGVTDFVTYFQNNESDFLATIQSIRLMNANNAQFELFGTSSFEEFVEYEDLSVKAEDAAWSDAYLQELSDFANGDTTTSVEVSDFRADGSRIEVRMISRITDHAIDDWSEVISTHEDITDRRRAEEELLVNEQRFRDLIEGSIQGILIHNGTKSLFVNQSYADTFGYDDPEELISQSTPRDHAAPHEHERLKGYAKLRLDGGPAPTSYEFQGVKKDGTLIWLNNRVRSITWDNQPALQLTVVDITDRKLAESHLRDSEERYRALASVSPVGIFRTNAEGRVTYVNEKWCELGGITYEESLGDGWIKALHPDDAAESARLWEKYVTSNTEFKCEQRYQQQDGSVTSCFSQATSEFDSDGNVVGHVGVITDISEQKKNERAMLDAQAQLRSQIVELEDAQEKIELAAEEQKILSDDLAKSRDKAEAANQAKSNFLATMSHEIRTPLNGVLGLAQLLGGSKLDQDQRKKVDVILSSGQTLLAIINDVLDMSRIEAGGIELEEKPFHLRNLLSSISTPFQSLADDKGLQLTVTNHVDSDLALKGDSVRMRQILWNLLSNAIKFTHDGSVALTIQEPNDGGGRAISSKDHLLRFSFVDSGVGIAPDRVTFIFGAFTQEDSSTTRKYGGTGLGLSIVKQLVELMGGIVEVESELDLGTRFDVYLPFFKATEAETKALSLQNLTDNIGQIAPLNVLIAEDNDVNALIAKSFMEKFGHNVRHVENGKLAVEAANDDWVDLILMDIHMPEMNGIDATRLIRSSKRGQHLPIVGLTAEAFVERHAVFIKAGMDGVLTKPFTEQQLAETLTTYRWIRGTSSESTTSISTDFGYDTDDANLDEWLDNTGHESTPSSDNTYPIGDEDKLKDLRDQIGSDAVGSLLHKVQESLQDRVEELRQGIDTLNTDQIRAATHSIKGACGSMFAVRVSELAAAIEEQANDIDAVQRCMPEFEDVVRETIQWWRNHSN